MGRRASTNTPDGGLIQFAYDADGQQISKITPNLRAKNQQISYQYQLHRLTTVDYPGTADDVTYTYGAMGALDNGALRHELIVPSGGIAIRARGRRVVDSGPDLLFYTNAVQVR